MSTEFLCFNNLDTRQSKLAYNSASVVMRAKERDFAIAKGEKKLSMRPSKYARITQLV